MAGWMQWLQRHWLRGVVAGVVLLAIVAGGWLVSERRNAAEVAASGGIDPALSPAVAEREEAGAADGDARSPVSPVDGAAMREAARMKAIADYREARTCLEYASARQWLARFGETPESEEAERWSEAHLDTAQRLLEVVRDNESHCRGRERLLADGGMHEIMLRAALAGHLPAARCYVSGALQRTERQRVDPTQFEAYRRHAPDLIEAGIRAGDWHAVRNSIIRYDPFNQEWPGRGGPWLTRLSLPDMEKAYTYARLAILGTGDPRRRERLQKDADFYRVHLDPSQAEQANRQAQALYERHFAGAGDYHDRPGLCGP